MWYRGSNISATMKLSNSTFAPVLFALCAGLLCSCGDDADSTPAAAPEAPQKTAPQPEQTPPAPTVTEEPAPQAPQPTAHAYSGGALPDMQEDDDAEPVDEPTEPTPSKSGLVFADDEAADVWDKVQRAVDFSDTLKYFVENYKEVMNEPRVRRLLEILQRAYNNTRLSRHRGHTPIEMREQMIKNGKTMWPPTIVPGSTHAANMLKGVSTELSAMGFNLDLNSNATIVNEGKVTKKVYPNDPCPCGSGKKFKKCCGR